MRHFFVGTWGNDTCARSFFRRPVFPALRLSDVDLATYRDPYHFSGGHSCRFRTMQPKGTRPKRCYGSRILRSLSSWRQRMHHLKNHKYNHHRNGPYWKYRQTYAL